MKREVQRPVLRDAWIGGIGFAGFLVLTAVFAWLIVWSIERGDWGSKPAAGGFVSSGDRVVGSGTVTGGTVTSYIPGTVTISDSRVGDSVITSISVSPEDEARDAARHPERYCPLCQPFLGCHDSPWVCEAKVGDYSLKWMLAPRSWVPDDENERRAWGITIDGDDRMNFVEMRTQGAQ